MAFIFLIDSVPSILPHIHVLLCHTTRIHTISLKKACAFCPRVFRVGVHVFYVSVPACCYSRIMPVQTCYHSIYCWDYLKKRIRKLQLDNVRDLQNAIRREWQRLLLVYIRRLVMSMRCRCDVVLGQMVGIHLIEPAKVFL